MNFHSTQRWQKPWLTTEEAKVIALRAEGKTYRYIAGVLCRSIPAVKDRAVRLRLRPRREAVTVAPAPVLTITKEELPLFYALGWRVESYDAHHCGLIWPHRTPPKMPEVA